MILGPGERAAAEANDPDEIERVADRRFRRVVAGNAREALLEPRAARGDVGHGLARRRRDRHEPREPGRRDNASTAHFASGSGRSWKCSTLLVVPFPVSMWKGARVPTVA